MSKQSSVEWYINNLIEILGDEICNKLTIEQINKIHNLGNQAVAMHKEECVDLLNTHNDIFDTSEDHYNETFGGNNESNI